MPDFIEHAARTLATAEADHQAAVEAHAAPAAQAQQLRERIQTKRARIAELRAVAAGRQLNDQEAAELNLAVLDLADLEALLPEADARCQQALELVQKLAAAVANHQAELAQATALSKVKALQGEVRELEQRFVEGLQRLWQEGQRAQRDIRFNGLWTPSDALRRAATYLQPPLGSFSGS